MSVVAVIALVTFFFILIISKYIKCKKYIKHLERYPSPPTVPLLGNALDFKPPVDFISKFAEYAEQYGDIVKLYLGPIPSKLIISNYKLIEMVLNSNTILNKGREYKYFSNWLGNGLLLSDGDSRWRSHRKLLLPSFHVQIFQEFLEIFETNAQLLVKKLEQELEKPSFDIHPYIQLCSLDMICEAAMGTSIHAQENSNSDYARSVKLMGEMFVKRSYSPILRNDFLYRFSNLYKEEKRALRILHGHTTAVIENRKKELRQKAQNHDVFDKFARKKKLTLLDLILEKRNEVTSLTDTAVREEIETFMFAGHDTTATALGFTTFCLSQNLKIQNNVVEELNEIFADDISRLVTLEDITKMRYMEAVIKEALRIYTPVPYISRTVSDEFEFDGGTIPQGVTVLLNIHGLHHNPKYFPDPDRFIPERFLGDHNGNGFPYSHIPFSAGPRNCIGQKFAMLEMKSVLSILLRHYEILPSNPRHTPLLSTQTVLFSKNGIHVRIAKRK
ncbi:hypothetical protein RI129_004606 [Pyrocoelia pectoralis]|uniref:Cytochrome P450 n=1 Tax=Pyrocoelia pectoralis TaxID=417401 RepID=A0AAN7ZJH6_9COLE